MPTWLAVWPRHVVRIRFWDKRLDLLLLRRQLLRQLPPFHRLDGRRILRLPDIVLQVIQLLMPILEEPDQLPVSVSNTGAGSPSLIAVVGLVPESIFLALPSRV